MKARFLHCLLATAIAGASTSSFACDQTQSVIHGIPVTHSVVSVTTVPCATQQSIQRLQNVGVQVQSHVTTCRDDLRKAAIQFEGAKLLVSEVQAEKATALKRMVTMRNLLKGCSEYVCIEGKLFSKEDIAGALSAKLDQHRGLEQLEAKRLVALAAAEKHQTAMVERLAKWQKQQQELISRVDALQSKHAQEQAAQQAAIKKAAEQIKLSAVEEALRMADQIESQLKSVGAASPAPAAVPVGTVSQAAAEFDRLIGASSVSMTTTVIK